VSKVVASRHDARVAYVTFDGHWDDDMKPYLFRTSDGGATWTSIAGDIPAWKPIKTLEEDPRNPNVLFAGTEFGLYYTTDGGAHWTMPAGNVPPVMIDRIIVNPRTNDLILGTHGRSVIILEDISPLELTTRDEVQLFPLRAAVEVQRYRDLPWPGGEQFVAPNSPVGTYITYSIATDPPRRDSVTIRVTAPDGSVVDELSGPDAKGTFRVLWDMRYRFKYVPPASDSGFYGPPRAPYVPPGRYTVKLIARGRELAQSVDITADPRGASTPEGQRVRAAINLKARDISRAYYDAITTMDAIDAEVARLRPLAKDRPDADSALTSFSRTVTQLRQRARGNSIVSGIGRLFDLTAAIESSSMPPTEAQRRSIDASVAEFTDIVAKVNDAVTKTLPEVQTKLGQPATRFPSVRPPQ
jgi:hypothetical protein